MTLQRLIKILAWIAIVLVGAALLRVVATWIMGESPYLQYLKLVHNDIPRLTVPVRLQRGVPSTFRARVVQGRSYELNLLVNFSGDAQRAAVHNLIGGPIAQPSNLADPPGELRSICHIVVQDEDGQTILDRTFQSDGHIASTNYSFSRNLARVRLEEGLYIVSITPMNDTSRLDPFRTELELTYTAK